MRKIFIFALVLSAIFICKTGFAHPASDIKITFDPATKILKAEIIHNVSNPQTHFISKIDIALNGSEILEHRISIQDNNVSQVVLYLIPDVKEKDVISLEAYCNISGKLTKTITVKAN